MPTFAHLLLMYGLAFGFQNKLPFLYGKSKFIDRLLTCTYCLGFHCGWMTWIAAYLVEQPGDPAGVMVVIAGMWAFIGAAISYFVDALVKWFEEVVPVLRDAVLVYAAANGVHFANEEE